MSINEDFIEFKTLKKAITNKKDLMAFLNLANQNIETLSVEDLIASGRLGVKITKSKLLNANVL